MPWLVRGEDVLASAEVAVTGKLRRQGLRGRDHLDGVLVLRPCRQVHTFGMEFPIDVVVLRPLRLRVAREPHATGPGVPVRVPRVLRDRGDRGSFDRWEIGLGDVVEVRG